MRVTQSMMSNQVAREISAAFAALARQQERVSSGNRILVPSDDPAGTAQAVAIRSRQAAATQFQSNMATAQTTLSAADVTLRSVEEVVTQGIEAAVQGANDTNDPLARQAVGTTVNQLLETLVSLANSRTGTGTFLFGGQESTIAPYTAARDSAGQITTVVPNPRGIDGATDAAVGEGVNIATRVSGTTVFGAATDESYAFDVLIKLRDSLFGQPELGFGADVLASGAANPTAFTGVASATDLQIRGPSGTAFIGPTVAGDDTVSYSGNATSAVAVAARINLASATTGVTATATRAQISYEGGTFASDLTLDGTAGRTLVLNGVAILGAVSGASALERRDALVALVNGQSGATGVTASAVPQGDGFALTASDGRNISVETDGTLTPGGANAVLFGFSAGLTATGAATSVVARGGVDLRASAPITVTPATGSPLASQMIGQGSTEIENALGNLHGVLDRVLVPSTLVGTRMAWLATLGERASAEQLSLTTDLSKIEDVDMVKAITDLQLLQTFYTAALASGAKIMQQSLVDFIR
jgi:flagellar hook-associated protein 3